MKVKQSVLVTGETGQLARSIKLIAEDYPDYTFTFTSREQLDFSQPATLSSYFETKHFDIIINCAAYTAVDKAEDDIELANKVNSDAVRVLAAEAKRRNTALIHISTDYVFDGTAFKPYQETNTVNPVNAYGSSKYEGEKAFLASSPRGMIIRTSWVYSEFGHNFVKTMLRLGMERDELNIVADQVGTPTYAGDLAKTIMSLIEQINSDWPEDGSRQLYHYSNEGVCSWYDFAKAIFELSQIDCVVKPIKTEEYPTPAKRPHYSLLDKTKIKHDFQLTIPYWRESLALCLNRME